MKYTEGMRFDWELGEEQGQSRSERVNIAIRLPDGRYVFRERCERGHKIHDQPFDPDHPYFSLPGSDVLEGEAPSHAAGEAARYWGFTVAYPRQIAPATFFATATRWPVPIVGGREEYLVLARESEELRNVLIMPRTKILVHPRISSEVKELFEGGAL